MRFDGRDPTRNTKDKPKANKTQAAEQQDQTKRLRRLGITDQDLKKSQKQLDEAEAKRRAEQPPLDPWYGEWTF